MTTNARTKDAENAGWGFGTQVPFEAINAPGCYVCHWSGHLVRVPDNAIKPGRSPLLSIKGTEPLFVTFLSADPYVPVSKARMLAADCDVVVNF